MSSSNKCYKIKLRGFPGSPVFRTLCSLLRAWVQFLVWELRAHKPPDEAKKKKKRKTKLRRARSQGAGRGTVTSRVAWEGSLCGGEL